MCDHTIEKINSCEFMHVYRGLIAVKSSQCKIDILDLSHSVKATLACQDAKAFCMTDSFAFVGASNVIAVYDRKREFQTVLYLKLKS